MIARRLVKGWRLKRRFKRSSLIALRIARRHYMSLVSLGILGLALALAMTHSPFDVGAPAASAPVEDTAPITPATLTTAAVQAPPADLPRSVVYYFIDSEAARRDLEMALHRDLADETLRNYAPLHSVSHVFVMVEDARDEAEALEFLRQLAISPPRDGTTVRVVDLR